MWWEQNFKEDLVVRRMTWLQKLLYRCLLQEVYVCETQPYAPSDDESLSVLSGAESLEMWLANRELILSKFESFERDNVTLLRHKRLEADWQQVNRERQEKDSEWEAGAEERREQARKAARARWQKPAEGMLNNAEGMLNEAGGVPNDALNRNGNGKNGSVGLGAPRHTGSGLGPAAPGGSDSPSKLERLRQHLTAYLDRPVSKKIKADKLELLVSLDIEPLLHAIEVHAQAESPLWMQLRDKVNSELGWVVKMAPALIAEAKELTKPGATPDSTADVGDREDGDENEPFDPKDFDPASVHEDF
jgi:uncharacterized protein YdaU (DUF1376 family)